MKVTSFTATKSPQGRKVTVAFDDGTTREFTFGPTQQPDKSWTLPPVADVAREVKALVQAHVADSSQVADTALQVELDKP